jgi:uncharacterized protein YycO
MGADQVIAFARQQIGKPYRFGAVGPNQWDCSGLVVGAFKAGAGKTLPHFTGTLVTLGTAVSKAQLQPGDLVFPDYHHVQIYTGNGMVVEAPRTGLNVREVKMWGFWKARRLIAPGSGTAGSQSGNSGVVTTGVSNPLVPDWIETLVNEIGSPAVWRIAGLYVAGGLLVVVGLTMMVQGQLKGVIK